MTSINVDIWASREDDRYRAGERWVTTRQDITLESCKGQKDDKSDGMVGLGGSSQASFCPFVLFCLR